MKQLITLATFFLVLSLCGIAVAQEIAVIVNKENHHSVDRALINKIYTGAITRWLEGGNIKIFEPSESHPTNAAFAARVIGQSQQKLKEHWANLVFTGKSAPPRQLASDDDIIKAVAGNKNAIGYINAAKVDDSVRLAYMVK